MWLLKQKKQVIKGSFLKFSSFSQLNHSHPTVIDIRCHATIEAKKTAGRIPFMKPSIFFFDMDHTLINNDCDVSWKQFLVARGIAPPTAMDEADRFFQQYVAARLDIQSFLAFQLREFKGRSQAEMTQLCLEHFHERVKPEIYEDGQQAVAEALHSGAPTVLLTATNNVIAKPLADFLGISELSATDLELKNDIYTGEIAGTYCAGEGKIIKAQDYCRIHQVDFSQACYYGDSLSDIPLLSTVAFPVVCNPGPELEAMARKKEWPIKKFR